MTVGPEVSGRIGPSRRAVVRGAVWSVPVVAVASAAPAFAASPCTTSTVAWSTLGDGTVIASGSQRTFGNARMTVTYTGTTNAPNNAKIYTSAQTGGTSSALRFFDANTSSTSQTITFTFDKMVKNVSFTLLDVDSATASFSDQVQVGPAGYTFSRGSTVTGTGASGDVFKASNANTVVGAAGTSGNVVLTWAAALNQVTLIYSQYSGNVGGSPFIGVSNLTFQAQDC